MVTFYIKNEIDNLTSFFYYRLKEIVGDLQENTFEEYVAADDDLECVQALTDSEIVESVKVNDSYIV